MTTSTMKLPASYAVIDAEEMTYLDGGASSEIGRASCRERV